MNLVFISILAFVAVGCLADIPGKRPGRPGKRRGPPAPRKPPPKRFGVHRDNPDPTSEKNGWGWNGDNSLHYGKPPRCLKPSDIPPTPYYDPDLFRQRLWYTTGGTKYGYNTYYRIFNGRYATSQSQIDQICFASIFGETGPVINSGSGVQFTQNCTTGQVTSCYMSKDPATYDKSVDIFAALERQDAYLIKTDNKTYCIYYLCNDYVRGDLQLLSTRPYVKPEVFRDFLAYFKTFNISISEAEAGLCKSPQFHGPYPHPFENYPHSGVASGWGQDGWHHPAPVDGWSSPSAPAGGWPSESDHGWSDNNGWSDSGNNGWSDNGWGWDSYNDGWEKNVEHKKEEQKMEDKKVEPVAEQVAEVAQ